MPRLIFHYPRPIPDAPKAGSQVRVASMLAGFESLGADVTVVDGFGKQRVQEMRRLARAVRRGDRFDAVYSEFTTMPTILADEHHLPTHPFADFAFLRQMRSSGAGVGLFYRDVHWQFGPYRARTPAHKRWPALVAYRAEVIALRHCLDRLFVPSVAMTKFVPGWEGDSRVFALPPGSPAHDLPWTPGDGLRLLYVGSVQGPVYDVNALVEAVVANDRASITICCPEFEAALVAHWVDTPRVTVVHEHGAGLVELYRNCDVSCVAFPPHAYRDFMMPVKLFESVGMGRPILGVANDMAGRYVAEHGLGWAPPLDQLSATIKRLAGDTDEVRRVHKVVVAAQPHHTWAARCETVLDELTHVQRDD